MRIFFALKIVERFKLKVSMWIPCMEEDIWRFCPIASSPLPPLSVSAPTLDKTTSHRPLPVLSKIFHVVPVEIIFSSTCIFFLSQMLDHAKSLWNAWLKDKYFNKHTHMLLGSAYSKAAKYISCPLLENTCKWKFYIDICTIEIWWI